MSATIKGRAAQLIHMAETSAAAESAPRTFGTGVGAISVTGRDGDVDYHRENCHANVNDALDMHVITCASILHSAIHQSSLFPQLGTELQMMIFVKAQTNQRPWSWALHHQKRF